MNLEILEKGKATVVKVEGHVGSEAAHQLETAGRHLMESDSERVVIDLQDADFIGSAAICHLVVIGKAIKKQGRDFILVPNASIRKVLEMGGIDNLFTIAKSVDKVIGSHTGSF